MKALNDYINIKQNNNLYENYLLERLCTHCSLEFKLMNGKADVLTADTNPAYYLIG